MNATLIADTLGQHHTWDVQILKGLMVCKGCDWSRKPVRGESNTDAFRQHQADMVAAVVGDRPAPAADAPREDLTVFAALIARLGGDVTITWAEADRLQGVAVTRWDEPEHMRYRFTIGAPEFNTPADVVAPARLALQKPDGTYKSIDELRAEVIAPATMMPAEELQALHGYALHPGYEYATTEGQRKNWNDADTPPEGEGWERNTDRGRNGWDRFDYTEESYWRRPRQVADLIAPPHQCESWQIRRNDAGDRYCAACGTTQ